ncbi:hypothetical protein BD779DRAFT_1612878 [Infundibulicybe gibba]|nr:hypothetical protein BD779DRAFT_1612878 [Infundibulicybe gibba]
MPVSLAAVVVKGPPQDKHSLPNNQDAKGKGKAFEVYPGEGEDEGGDGASISSYETGHEAFEIGAAGESSPEDDLPTTPPPPPPHEQANNTTSKASNYAPQNGQTPKLNHAPPSHTTPAHSEVSVSTESTDAGPRRRKSVRVSLQPTFSPTPPAIDDDDETVDRAPWGGKTNGEVARDMWEDSSEEEAEYSKAKRLLTRAAKKEKKAW